MRFGLTTDFRNLLDPARAHRRCTQRPSTFSPGRKPWVSAPRTYSSITSPTTITCRRQWSRRPRFAARTKQMRVGPDNSDPAALRPGSRRRRWRRARSHLQRSPRFRRRPRLSTRGVRGLRSRYQEQGLTRERGAGDYPPPLAGGDGLLSWQAFQYRSRETFPSSSPAAKPADLGRRLQQGRGAACRALRRWLYRTVKPWGCTKCISQRSKQPARILRAHA